MRKTGIDLVLAIFFVCGLLVGTVSYAIYEQVSQIRNVGTIRTIGVEIYRDEALTEILDVISWGMLNPGENRSVNAWVKNTGNAEQKLVIWTENWNPTNASTSIILTWNYSVSWIPVNASIALVFTLSVDTNITGITNFSFDIWVKGIH